MVERLKTYIERFDQELGGGIPKGHVVLVSGTPGTMKTSLVFSIIYNSEWDIHKIEINIWCE